MTFHTLDEAGQVPARTANEFSLSDGRKVWIKTLNKLERGWVQREADDYSTHAIVEYVEGGSKYALLRARAARFPVAMAADRVAAQALLAPEFWEEMDEKYPIPERPEREEDEETADFAKSLAEWSAKVNEANRLREEAQAKRSEEARAAFLALPREKQVEDVYDVLLNAMHWEALEACFDRFLLYKAVRNPELHTELFFTLEEMLAMEDSVLAELKGAYYALDTVSVNAIPTLPATSGASQD